MNNEQTTDAELLRKIEQLPEEITIPLSIDTKCAKCGQQFWRSNDAVMTTHCVDGGHHEWQSELADLRQRLAAAEAVIEHYADKSIWSTRVGEEAWGAFCYLPPGVNNGYDCANQYFTKYPRNEQTEDK